MSFWICFELLRSCRCLAEAHERGDGRKYTKSTYNLPCSAFYTDSGVQVPLVYLQCRGDQFLYTTKFGNNDLSKRELRARVPKPPDEVFIVQAMTWSSRSYVPQSGMR